MIVCPLCEHAQVPAEACQVCGRPLAGTGGAGAEVPRLEGLEPTRLEGLPPVAVEPVEGLEPTHFDAPAAVPAGNATWIEQTVGAPVGTVAVQPLEVERIPRQPPPVRDPFAAVVCRYCTTAAAPGDAFCARCGMKLEVYRPGAREA
jgi:hypothetical protein